MVALPALAPVHRMVRRASGFLTPLVGDESHRSYPIVIRGASRLQLGFLLCRRRRTSESSEVELAAPEYLAAFDADSGKLAELRQFRVAELGSVHSVDSGGATLGSLPNQTSVEDDERLWLVYDALLPSFAAGTQGVPRELRAVADEFRSLFARLMEPPLSVHYRTLGHAFMAWVETDEP